MFVECVQIVCSICAVAGNDVIMQSCDLTPGCLGKRCKCGKRLKFKDVLSEYENDLCIDPILIRQQLAFMCHVRRSFSTEEVVELTELDLASSAMDIYRRWVETVSLQQTKQND
jgi:hypothetical protein